MFAQRFSLFFRRRWCDLLAVSALTAIVLFIAFKTIQPNTFLSGWDNLHPEFNFGLNIGRSLSATWQEYQGVGLLGGMSHAADLPRQLMLWAASLFIPMNLLRTSWTFAMLWLGPVGVYVWMTSLLKKHVRLAAFVSALFYLCNLATVQYFYTPYESFSSFYGFLPWLLWGVTSALATKKYRRFFLLAVIATPAFYVQTLFVVFASLTAVFSLETLIRERHKAVKKIILVGAVLLAANAYWLSSSLYFTLTNASVTLNAKINRLSTPDSQFMNREFGTFKDIALLRGYWFDYTDYQKESGYQFFMPQWRDYIAQPQIETTGLVIFALMILGFVCMALQKLKYKWSLLTLLCFVLLVMTSGNGQFGILFSWMQQHIPLFGEMFRTTFTKWSVVAALFYAMGLGFLIHTIVKAIPAHLHISALLPVAALSAAIIIFVYPMFTGQLIYSKLQSSIPAAYFELFHFFDQQPKEARIATLPANSFWGWNFYDWEYRGSGFLWYGITQPILDRAFDVWSSGNEGFYDELSTALRLGDNHLLAQVLHKYDVTYLLVDDSVMYPSNDPTQVKPPDFSAELKSIGAQEVWQKDFLHVYLFTPSTSFLSAPSSYTTIDADTQLVQKDIVFEHEGNYVQTSDHPQKTYPFADILQENPHKIIFSPDHIDVKSSISDLKLSIPVTASSQLTNIFSTNCDIFQRGLVSVTRQQSSVDLLATEHGSACATFLSTPILGSEALLHISSQNDTGRSLHLYVTANNSHLPVIEDLLPSPTADETFSLLASTAQQQTSFITNVENKSFGTLPSHNEVHSVSVLPVNLSGIADTVTVHTATPPLMNMIAVHEQQKIGTFLYTATVNAKQAESLVTLLQGYNRGWIAFSAHNIRQFFPHHQYNGWANAWFVPQGEYTLVILYWPQLLSFTGYAFLFLTFVGFILRAVLRKRRAN